MSVTVDNTNFDINDDNIEQLKTKAIIGFDGNTKNGFLLHPNGQYAIYSLGNKITIQNWITKEQHFLVGHTKNISAIALSNTGKYIASGQINHIGFKAKVIIWDFETKKKLDEHEYHKVRVEAIVFSKDERFLISLGGKDCGSVIIWDMHVGKVICGTNASHGCQGNATVLLPMTRRSQCFITAGDNHLAVWRIDMDTRNVFYDDVKMSKLKRIVLCADANERDEVLYCGTTTGDILKIRLNFHHDTDIIAPVRAPSLIGCFAKLTKKKLRRGEVDLYQNGVRSIKRLFSGQLVIGAGDGTLELAVEAEKIASMDCDVKMPSVPALKILKSTNVNSSITTIQLLGENSLLVGTAQCEIYQVNMQDFNAVLIVTCHTSAIYDIAFPHNFSEVFATASHDSVRIWSMITTQELLRICVSNFTCSSLLFAHDGESLLTAWNDGIIRSFTPLTGRLIYAILNAHNKGVSALSCTSDGKTLISGGREGQVRLWNVSPYKQELICTLKEHKGPISAIHINKFNTEAVSASNDGSCIIWDLERQCRRQILFATTMFMCVRFYPTAVQILTGGADRKIAYWEVLDGSLVREIEGSSTGSINALDISPNGEYFITGGNDQVIKLWKYQEGIATHEGHGHAAAVTAVCFSADGRYMVTACASGTIFIWKFPQKENQSIEKEIVEETVHKKSEKQEDIRDLPSARSNICCACPKHPKVVGSQSCKCVRKPKLNSCNSNSKIKLPSSAKSNKSDATPKGSKMHSKSSSHKVSS